MRIAIAIHEYPPVGGGASTAAAQTARALAALGHQVLVVTGHVPGLPAEEEQGGVTVHRLPALRFVRLAPSKLELLSFSASAALALAPRIRAFRADGVLAYFAVPVGPFAVRAARRLGVPVVVSLRGSDVPGFRHGRLDGPFGTIARPVIRWVLGQADAVAPNSEVLREMALAFAPGIAGKVEVVPNGIEDVADAPARSGDAALRLIQVGQLIERKRVDVTLDALAALPGTRLTVIGDGPLRGALVERARDLGLDGRVELTGHLPRAEILARLRRHDVFVMTSAAEGMSNAMVEAMAAGLPIVTTPNGSHDLVERAGCGVVVPFGDAAAVARAIRAVTPEMARAALDHARTLTWTATAERFVALLARYSGAR